jgi:hypothetical protein
MSEVVVHEVQKELVDELTQLSAMLHALIKSQKPPAA